MSEDGKKSASVWARILKKNGPVNSGLNAESDAILSKIDSSVTSRRSQLADQQVTSSQSPNQPGAASGSARQQNINESSVGKSQKKAGDNRISSVAPNLPQSQQIVSNTKQQPRASYQNVSASMRQSPVQYQAAIQQKQLQKQERDKDKEQSVQKKRQEAQRKPVQQAVSFQQSETYVDIKPNMAAQQTPTPPFTPVKQVEEKNEKSVSFNTGSSPKPTKAAESTGDTAFTGERMKAIGPSASIYLPPLPKIDEEPSTNTAIVNLTEFLFEDGYAKGLFSDVCVRMLGKAYNLHRIILCRFPFFRRMFLGDDGNGFGGLTDPDITIQIKDENVTTEGIEIVLASLYGWVCSLRPDDDPGLFSITPRNVLSVLATAYFFQHYSLMEYCLDFILSCQLAPHKYRYSARSRFPNINIDSPTPSDIILQFISFIDRYDYGPEITERIEDALLNYICLEGYTSLEESFIQMPLSWLERVLEADAFWCPNEFARYNFAKNVIFKRKLYNHQQNIQETGDDQRSSEDIYTDIFKFAIIYTHMTFEQLNEVRSDNLVAESILMKSLWHQTRFRSMVENFQESQASAALKEDEKQSATANAPIRLGVEFTAINDLKENERRYSTAFFYGGSWWTIFLQKFMAPMNSEDLNDTLQKVEKWGIFLRRSEGSALNSMAKSSETMPAFGDSTTGHYKPDVVIDPVSGLNIEKSVSYYNDKRKTVTSVFKIFNPVIKCYDPIFESKANDYAETQSWGYRSRDNIVTIADTRAVENGFSDTKIRFTLVMRYT